MRKKLGLFCLALCLSLAFGCQSLHWNPSGGEKPDKSDSAGKEPLPPPSQHSLRIAPYIFLSDFELKRDLPLFRDLSNLRDQVYGELQLPPSDVAIQVFVFEDRDRYERYIRSKYPDLPKRRAFFVAQPHSVGGGEDLLVYTYWGDRIGEDLRHELTHALLHSVLKDVPLWLDEGLAEYFETPAESQGINPQHLGHLRPGAKEPFKPDLDRLEKLGQVQQMSPAEYREAWAWVHLMLRGKAETKAVLIRYLQQLRVNPTPGPLRPLLAEALPAPEESLFKHVASLEAVPRRRVVVKYDKVTK